MVGCHQGSDEQAVPPPSLRSRPRVQREATSDAFDDAPAGCCSIIVVFDRAPALGVAALLDALMGNPGRQPQGQIDPNPHLLHRVVGITRADLAVSTW